MYARIQSALKKGFNTFDTRSVMTHVRMPDGLAVRLSVKTGGGRRVFRDNLIGRQGRNDERIVPGFRSMDGAYTSLTITCESTTLRVESAAQEDRLVLLVTPLAEENPYAHAKLLAEGMFLWNKPGTVLLRGDRLTASCGGAETDIFACGNRACVPTTFSDCPCLTMELDEPVCVSVGTPVTREEARAILDRARAKLENDMAEKYGEDQKLMGCIQAAMAWDTIYEPEGDRVCSTVSRIWNVEWSGYVLFCWDTYFASLLCMKIHRELACANLVEITRAITGSGFVPNFISAGDVRSRDRSQPPVGSLAALQLYRQFGEKWIPEEVYDDLLTWNRWFKAHRTSPISDNLCWGSDPFVPHVGAPLELRSINDRQGAAYESGLDNSPMFDDVPFNTDTHLMEQEDVGLTGLYIMDCEALAEIAHILGKGDEAELRSRAEACKQSLEQLWDEEAGFYYNRRTDTGEFNRRISPTNFYALYSDRVSEEHARRMEKEHYFNEKEFFGQWMIPATPHNDPAFSDQMYWRGRIWAPLNYLTYMAMKKHSLKDACRDLAEKSEALFMKEWDERGHVHENYNSVTGEGCDSVQSDRFYHWGALLCLLPLMEKGVIRA